MRSIVRRLSRLCGVVLVAASLSATANVILDVRDGVLYGASGVPIGDRLFDVQFVTVGWGSWCPPDPALLFFANGANGHFARGTTAQALLDYVLGVRWRRAK